MVVNRARGDEIQTVLGATVVGGATDPTIAYPAGLGKCLGKWVNFCVPPEAIPLRRGLILPPPRTSILDIGPWPPSAQGICDLFILPTNVTIDLGTAFMSREIRSQPKRAWFGLEIGCLHALDRKMITSAHITLLSGVGAVIEQTEKIARTLHKEFGYWKRKQDGLTCTLKRPPPNFRSD